MKNLVSLAIVFLAILTSCNKNEFIIKGYVYAENPVLAGCTKENPMSGTLCLYAEKQDGTIDTLKFLKYTNNKFEIKGEVDQYKKVFLSVDDDMFAYCIYLQPGTIQGVLHGGDGNDYSILSGTPLQDYYNRYRYIHNTWLGNLKKHEFYVDYGKEINNPKMVKEAKEGLKQNDIDVCESFLKLVKENPTSLVARDQIKIQITSLDTKNLVELEKILQSFDETRDIAEQCATILKARKSINIGQVAPNLTLKLIDGKKVKLHDVKADYKVIDFWASWCKPCRASLPSVKKLYNKYKDKNVQFINISLDENEKAWKRASKKDGIIWMSACDKGFGSESAMSFNVIAIPKMFVLDKNNKFIETNIHANELEEVLNKLIK
ncbi:MAG: AhpC/TSA family protein [Bacteroidales bacterium]|nr:AhpC/TSA family protein [Bacteroidales bacterium]